MLEAVCEGAWLGSNTAAASSKDDRPFSSKSMDLAREVHPAPQVAMDVQSMCTGSSSFSTTLHAKATAEEGKRPVFLDIFCGTAGVAAAVKRFGFEALGIDHVIDKRRMKGPAVKLDLTLPSSQNLVFEEIKHGRVDGVMLAPPCGTSSKARNIPLKTSEGKRKKGPPPLRSEAYPEGLPGLVGVNRTRVRQANKLYKFTQKVMEFCAGMGIPCIVENPQSSLMWKTKWLKNPHSTFIWHVVHACMYGSKRLKKTALLINFEAANLRKLCDNSHKHLPWTHKVTVDPETNKTVQVFDTASEAEYPRAFCEALAVAFTLELQSRGLSWSLEPPMEMNAAYLANNKQPRGGRSHAVISEFKHMVQVTVPEDFHLPDTTGSNEAPPLEGLPVARNWYVFTIYMKRGNRM